MVRMSAYITIILMQLKEEVLLVPRVGLAILFAPLHEVPRFPIKTGR